MRISDWSSDVCSSDLDACAGAEAPPGVMPSGRRAEVARQAGRRRPELLQAAQRVVGGVEAVRRQLDVVELAGVLVEQGRKVAVDVDPLGRGAHMERPAVVRRALLDEIAVLDHQIHVVRYVRAHIRTTEGSVANGKTLLAAVEEVRRSNVLEGADALAIGSGFSVFEALAVT